MRTSIFPDEAEAIAVVDPNAVLSGSVAFQRLQRIAWRTEIVKRPGCMKLKQFSNSDLFDGLIPLDLIPRKTRSVSAPRKLQRTRHGASIHQPISHREPNQLIAAVQIELLHDAAAMGIHRVDAQVQHYGDFLVGLAFRDHLQHLALAAG